MSLVIQLTPSNPGLVQDFNAESIISIERAGLSSILSIDDNGRRSEVEVGQTPLAIVNRIDDAARKLPEAFRSAALFIQLMDNSEPGQHNGIFFNADKISSQERLGDQTRLAVAGAVYLVDESPQTIKALGDTALANRMPPPPKPWERKP